MHLHETEIPVMLKDGVEPVGYAVHTKDFSFMAIYETDGSVNVAVEWGDDQPGDFANHHSMTQAKSHLETLLKASEPETPVVKLDLRKAVSESVTEALTKIGLPDTPHNRVGVLNDMHKTIPEAGFGFHTVRDIKHILEDLIVELQDQI